MSMGGGISLPDGWHMETIINPTAITLGNGLADLLTANIQNCSDAYGFVLNEYTDSFPENSTVTVFQWNESATDSKFSRYYNGFNSDGRTMTNTYACKIPQGAKIIVFWHDPLTT